MTHLEGRGRFQTLLLPESLDDYVGLENPVRFIDAFVDGGGVREFRDAYARARCRRSTLSMR